MAAEVGSDWARRQPPRNVTVAASPAEDEIARELEDVWLWPASGASPYSGKTAALFPWALAKAYLSSPAALADSIRERLRRLDDTDRAAAKERAALQRLAELTEKAQHAGSAKYDALLDYLGKIGVSRTGERRVVIFAERVATLNWLADAVRRDLRLADNQVTVLHGGLSDTDQQDIVESFKLESSPIRVLITGDIASEGVNLHTAVPPPAPLRHPVEPDPHRAAQRPHRSLRAASPPARSPPCCSHRPPSDSAATSGSSPV